MTGGFAAGFSFFPEHAPSAGSNSKQKARRALCLALHFTARIDPKADSIILLDAAYHYMVYLFFS
jgi:hypothetical protein